MVTFQGLKSLEIGGPFGAIYMPLLAQHYTGWSTPKGMITFLGQGYQTIAIVPLLRWFTALLNRQSLNPGRSLAARGPVVVPSICHFCIKHWSDNSKGHSNFKGTRTLEIGGPCDAISLPFLLLYNTGLTTQKEIIFFQGLRP